MVGRLVENDHVGPKKVGKSQQQPRLFTARQTLTSVSPAFRRSRSRRWAPRTLVSVASGISFDVIVGRGRRIQLVLVLRKIAMEIFSARVMLPEKGGSRSEQLDQRRFAVAVEPEQRDAIVGVDAQGDAVQHWILRIIAEPNIVDRDNEATAFFSGAGKLILRTSRVTSAAIGFIFSISPATAWCAFPRPWLEAIDKGLQALALGVLPPGVLGIEHLGVARCSS